ncbi:RXT2 [Candida pseudojiufengensis]|uniref:RXT2 n=1 Tax=Candida pseudojiufengensis TaxID=497109 RepID=UPI00222431AF|nr:RXT2 [Candida pseudojiufengensis]KAI5961360.1 RXT2 [Candida pseudojiufengensis]
MLDTKSLEIISQFKDALISRNEVTISPLKRNENIKDLKSVVEDSLPSYNRGLKLTNQLPNLDSLSKKTIEYDGDKYDVLTNDLIEKNNLRIKRKWKDFYQDPKRNSIELENQIEEDIIDWSDDEISDDESNNNKKIHPLKQSKIIELLSPLNHPSELITHPAISKTYQSEILNKLSMELIDLIEFEQNNLNWLNKLLQVLNGEDWFYLLEENLGLKEYDHGLDENRKKKRKIDVITGVADAEEQVEIDKQEEIEKKGETEVSNETNNTSTNNSSTRFDANSNEKNELENGVTESNRDSPATNIITKEVVLNNTENGTKKIAKSELPEASNPLSEYEDEEENEADPFFALPTAIKRYETFQESLDAKDETGVKEELINYLQVSIQRQHEYIENLTHLRNGLVRADRLKNDLLKWGKEMHDKKT